MKTDATATNAAPDRRPDPPTRTTGRSRGRTATQRIALRLKLTGGLFALLIVGGLVAALLMVWMRYEVTLRIGPAPASVVVVDSADDRIGEARTDALAATADPSASRVVRLSIAAEQDVPIALQRYLTARYPSFGAAMADAGSITISTSDADSETIHRAPILPSAELLLAKADALEQGIAVGLERAFVVGAPAGRIPSLPEFARALTAAILEAESAGAISQLEREEALIYLLQAPYLLDPDGANLSAGMVGEIEREADAFAATSYRAEPIGLWRRSPALQRAWRATRAWTQPLSSAAGRGIAAGFSRDLADGGSLLGHYQRWLAVLDRLHGASRRQGDSLHDRIVTGDVGSLDAGSGPLVGLLPTYREAPVDPAALLDPATNADIEAWQARLANLYAEPPDLRRTGGGADWHSRRLWARSGLLESAHSAQPGSIDSLVLRTAEFQSMRVGTEGPTIRREESLTLAPLRDETTYEAGNLGLRLEPMGRLTARLHRSFASFPTYVEDADTALTYAQLRAIHPVDARGAPRATDLLTAAEEAAAFFAALHHLQAADLGATPSIAESDRPSELQIAAADRWLRAGLDADPDLWIDRRRMIVLGITQADGDPEAGASDARLVWLGEQGVTFQPIQWETVRGARPDGVDEPVFALLPIVRRSIYSSGALLPSDPFWRSFGHALPPFAVQSLYPAAAPEMPGSPY